WERSKAEPIVELLSLLARYGLVEETQHGGPATLRLAAADTLVCWLLAALLGEQGIAVPLDAAWETFSYSNYNLKWIHDAAFVAQWQYLPVDHLLSVAANDEYVPWKRMMAVRALGRIMQAGRPDLREWLLALLRDECALLGEAVIDGLAAVASQIPAESLVAAVLKVDHGIST